MRVAILHCKDDCPSWLARADQLMKDAGFAGITSMWRLIPPLGSPDMPFATRALMPVEILERRSYNSSQRNALAACPGISGADRRNIANSDQLAAAIAERTPGIVLCEGDCPLDVLQAVMTESGCRVWVLNECWSDLRPSRYTRSWLKNEGFVETTLSEVAPGGVRRTLVRTQSQVPAISLSHGIHQHFWKLAHLPLRALEGRFAPDADSNHGTTRLTGAELVRMTGVHFYRRLRNRLLGTNDAAWAIAVGPSPSDGAMPASWRCFKPIVPPPDRFWADPFVVFHDGRHRLFFEEFLFEQDRGRIVVADVGLDGLRGEPVVVLETPWHLSYPQVFMLDGEWYMLPESGAERRVDLYRAESFPYAWRFERTLLSDIYAYDATLLRHDSRWWLFSAVTDGHGVSASDELGIHYADDLLGGSWQAHAGNPVVSDVTCARPAGSFIHSRCKLYRPAQDSRNQYGYGIVINEVETLTPDIYRERVVQRALLGEDKSGWRNVHTYNACNGLAVVDFLR